MHKVKRALVLGALAGQVDAIDALRARGIKTFACGHERKGPGVHAADEFHIADITDAQAVQRLAEELDVDLVYSVGSDIAMLPVVEVSKSLGTPHFHGVALTQVLRRKEELRVALAKAKLSPVAFEYIQSGRSSEWNHFPCIVKPVDAQGQRGITIVRNRDDLSAAIELAKASSSSDDAIVEELLIGPEISAHVIVNSGTVQLVIPSDRHLWEGSLSGIPRAHSIPLNPETIKSEAEINGLIRATVAALGVLDGPLYFQMIVTTEGPRIVEIASRLDGCHLWRMIRFSTGYDLLDDVIGRLCGEPWKAPGTLEAVPTTLQFFLDSPDIKVSEEYKFSTPTAGAEYVEWQLEPGELPRKTNAFVSRLGYEIYPGHNE